MFPRGGLPELIEHGIDGLICHEPSTGALVEALRTYFADPGLSAAHGKAALATSGRFGNAESGKRWAEVYSVGNRSATPSCGIRIVTAMI